MTPCFKIVSCIVINVRKMMTMLRLNAVTVKWMLIYYLYLCCYIWFFMVGRCESSWRISFLLLTQLWTWCFRSSIISQQDCSQPLFLCFIVSFARLWCRESHKWVLIFSSVKADAVSVGQGKRAGPFWEWGPSVRQEPSADRVHCELVIISIVQAAPQSFSWS